MYGQTYPTNPTAFGKISINTNVEDNTITKMSVQSSDNRINWLQPINIPIPITPVNYIITAPTLGAHLIGIDNKFASVTATTAGISTRVWFTADGTTVGGNPYYQTQVTKGTAPSAIQSVTNDDNQKKYYTQDLIGSPFVTATLFPPGTYAGNLSASTTPNSDRQRWTVELYKCDNSGTPIASGVTGAPVGDLGVTVITILDSGELTLASASITNVQVSGNLGTGGLSMAVGQRIRYHVSAEKIGTIASNITQSVYYGTSYNSFLDVPVPLNTTSVQNLSTVAGSTTTDALNALNTNKENKQTYIRYADDYANLTDAINATPAGGTLILGNHTYTGNISITRGNINIVGSKMPAFHATLDQLIGGTIINGTFVIDGQNVSLSNLGIDSGTAQCVALNSGNPMEGLVMHDIAATDLNFNNTAENVIAIVKANTTMHAILFEGLANSTFRNIHGKGGDFGVVFKISDSNATDIYGYESRTTNIYIKSDSYAPTLRSNFNNLNSVSNVITASQPVAVHASTSNLFDVNVNNVNIYGGTRQFRLIASPASTPTYVMSNVNVSNAVMENGVDVGLDLYGVVYNSAFNNILVRNTVSGQGVFSDFNGRGINFNNIRFDDNSGNNLDTAIDIRSYSILNNIVSIRNTDQTSLGGINLNNFANSSKIGEYVGNLKINGVSVNRDKLTGQGTINFLPKYETAGILKRSLFYDNDLDAGVNTASLYTLGAGWTMLNVANTTGSGFVSQVGVIPALRITSSTTNSSINELRNLPLNIGTNATARLIVGSAGDLSIVTAPTTSAGTYDFLTRNTSTGVIEKVTSASVATTASPTFTGNPTAPTPTAGDNDTSIATTAFVTGAIATADAGNVKLTGNQTITGIKTFNNTTSSSAIVLSNTSTGVGISSSNTNIGIGVIADNSGNGVALRSNVTSTGNGIVVNGGLSGSGLLFVGQNNSTDTFTVNKTGDAVVNTVTLNSVLKLKVYTVGTLPAGTVGDMAYVTDATAPTYNGTLTGGGAVKIPVFYDGTAWKAH
jgi:hypothetical protein